MDQSSVDGNYRQSFRKLFGDDLPTANLSNGFLCQSLGKQLYLLGSAADAYGQIGWLGL